MNTSNRRGHIKGFGRAAWCATLMLATTLVGSVAQAAPKVEDFFNDADVESVYLSPKGGYVAILGRVEGRQVLAIRNTHDLSKLTVPISDDQHAILHAHWINENRIGFTIKDKRQEFQGTVDEFAADLDGKNMVHLISGNWYHNKNNTGSNISSKILTAEYQYFAATKDGSDDIIVNKNLFDDSDGHVYGSHLYRLNTRTQKLSDLTDQPLPSNVFEWLLDEHDAPRVAYSRKDGVCKLHLRDPETKQWAVLQSGDCYDGNLADPWAFDPKGGLYVTGDHQGRRALFRFDMSTHKPEKLPLIALDSFDFDGTAEFDFANKSLAGVHYVADAQGTVWFEPAMKALQQKVDAKLKSSSNRIECPDECKSPSAVLVIAESDRQPRQFLLYDVASDRLTLLGSEHQAIKLADMGMRDFYHYAARDGRQIPIYVTQPAGKANGPRPAIVIVHGGPWVRGANWAWDPEAQFFASRGYVVLQPEFRGSTGYGGDLYKAGWKQWGQSMQDDLADAVKWAVDKGWVDSKNVGIYGASYGGYATLMGLIKHPDVYRFGIEYAGAVDMALRYKTPWSDATLEVLEYDLPKLMGDPEKDAAMFRTYSPLERAAELKQPLLIGHGGMDRRVPIIHAEKFYGAVKHSNDKVEWVVYNDEGHGFFHENNRVDFWKRVDAFLTRYGAAAKSNDVATK